MIHKELNGIGSVEEDSLGAASRSHDEPLHPRQGWILREACGSSRGAAGLCAPSPAEAVAGGAPVAVLRDGADRAVLDGAGP
ncbi:Hypothetical protein GLP15_1199, partial [Giardia lamblia P15]